jgi:pyruvate formate lyase activating enzyme
LSTGICKEERGIMETAGLITNFQDFAVHDGTGLRVLVFLKGCPLRCKWCQNPETIHVEQDLMYHERLCKECGKCFEVCESSAIRKDKRKKVDRKKCIKCMKCADICPTGALAKMGKWVTVKEVLGTFLEYKPFYDASDNGGVTISGGEPTYQSQFTSSLVEHCKNADLHTAIETCGYAEYGVMADIAKNIDLMLFDVKHMNDSAHKKITGVSNKTILSNLARLRKDFPDMEIIIRTPLIPDFNDTEENIRETGKFLSSLGIKKWDLLPFNTLASSKYNSMNKNWKFKNVERQDEAYLRHLHHIATSYIPDVTIGGMR